MRPEKFWVEAAQWGSAIAGGDPGACLYGFDERGLVQSEAHREDCIPYLDNHSRQSATGLDNPRVELAKIDLLIAYLRTAKVDTGQPMPAPRHNGREFLPSPLPAVDLDLFTAGYLECAEWLAYSAHNDAGDLSDHERAVCRGFTRRAIARAKRDCKAFQKAWASELTAYCEVSGRDMSSAGHDYWLSRNGHGAGFFDRGDAPVFRELQDICRSEGEVNCEYYRGRLHLG